MTGPRTATSHPVRASDLTRRVRRRPLLRTAFVFLLGVLSVFAARYAINNSRVPDRLIASLLRPNTTGGADVIVILGAGITDACTPNLNSLRRTLLGVRLFREGRAPHMLISGGAPRSGQRCVVGTAMAALAQEMGVPSASITVEDASRTTWENAAFSHPYLQSLGAHRLLVVTDRLHAVRAEACFTRFGYAIERATIPIYEGHRDNVDMLYQGLREMLAIRVYQHRGWIGSTAARQTSTPPSTSSPPNQAMAAPLSNREGPLVILGASYAGGWKVARLGGVSVVNKGIAGQQSFELLARFDADVLPAKPRAVILWGFINDVHRAPRDQIPAALTRARSTFEQMIARARTHGIEPILTTELTVRPPKTFTDWAMSWVGWAMGKTSYQDMVNGHVLATNQGIRDLARREGLLLLDIQPVLSETSGPRQAAFAVADGSHVSDDGYTALTRYAEPLLAAHFRRP